MSLRQPPQVPSAFEIRFSATDSILEVFEIQPDQNSQNVPDPFKKRDKIPRSSGSVEQFSYTDNNSGNTTSSQASPPIIRKLRHHSESSSKKVLSTNSVKSTNVVGPEADKQQRVNGVVKNSNAERSSSLGNDAIMTSNSTERKNILEDDPIIRHSNKKQRPKVDEIVSEREKDNLDKGIIPNHQIMDLSGRPEMAISNNKKIMPKPIIKNNKLSSMSTNTNNYKDDENKPLPKDGIATPPATPPRSPQVISQKHSDDSITHYYNHMNLYDSTPPSSSESNKSVTRPTRISQSSRKRRGSRSPQKSQSMLSTKRSIEMSAYQPPKKLQQPRGRRLSLASAQIIPAVQTQESSITTQSSDKSMESQKSQQSQSPTRSRIPRLSTSSRERPIIAQKVSQGSLSSQGSDKFNESKESSSSYPLVDSKFEPPRQIRLTTSRPIINTSLISDVEAGSESPTGYSPTGYSPTEYSPTDNSPTDYSPINSFSPSNHLTQKKLISHDDVVIPTIAKKLKMNGQLHHVNHDALLGYSEEPEDIAPMSENGYMDITDQVINLFDGPKVKSHKRQSSIPRKNSSTRHSRSSSKTHYIAPRKQPPQQSFNDVPSPTGSQFENSSEHSAPSEIVIRNKRGRSRREEYIISVREDDDDMEEFIEPRSSTTLVPTEPSVVPTVQAVQAVQAVQIESHDQIYQEKVEEPKPVQIPVVEEVEYNMIPAETASAPTVTGGKKKKDKKKKQKKSNSGNLDDDDYVRKSKCRCAIQ